ncbi:YicC family protein [soil metagenome]
MLLSMTGYGEARLQDDRWSVGVEVRAVNNRHFKFSARLGEPYSARDLDLERLVRDRVRRGTVQLLLRVEKPRTASEFQLNTIALEAYRQQLVAFLGGPPGSAEMAVLLTLPGVVESNRSAAEDPGQEWAELSVVINEALDDLQRSRAEEGRAMAAELLALAGTINGHLDSIAAQAPRVVEGYRDRLLERVQCLVLEQGVTIEPGDLIREVAILAERADIAEEITRLRAHLEQFVSVIHDAEGVGRKLEFIVQEMGRESNTIGSKANNVTISREVFEVKGAIEKIRELIQNVE